MIVCLQIDGIKIDIKKYDNTLFYNLIVLFLENVLNT